jgi:hypothetical protein
MLTATKLAIGIGSVENGGLFATLLAGAIGTGSTNVTSDSLGNVLNLVKIKDSTTDAPVKEAGGREVYGLVQAVSTAVDGDTIGGSGSENTQLSFVYRAANGTLTLTVVTATIQFGRNHLYILQQEPTIMMAGGNPTADVIAGAGVSATQGNYVVTTAFTAAEVITTSSGDGATGVSTKTGDTIALGASSGVFNANNLLQITLNGAIQLKGTDVVYDSATTFHFAAALDIDDYFEIRLLA